MTNTQKASVTTATATLRTIEIDNRQLTLSVAKQLDCLPFREVDAWGRVKFSNRQWAIGTRSGTDELVIGSAPYVDEHYLDCGMLTYDQVCTCSVAEDNKALASLPLIVLAGLK